ncbi:MAG: O-antigen ligase family protein [Drouetiella hepatica Uher 2000/2452]|jgi:O-antigen ligase|uniref:O-antigen ligase family protein n=1 Tax=Drouetiella hepatica Uher 2000/2452 TaxID=904376 RepID=A0A951UNQ1_9CYAN|nr:O-antigen ligase family protein [Drouetiella hepatica Uher 2000/2452]
MNWLKHRVEPALTVLCLFHYSQGALPLILRRGVSEGDNVSSSSFDYSLNLQIFFVIYLLTFFLLFIRWKKVLHTSLKDGWIWLLLGFAIFSFSWSLAPSKTISSWIALLITTLFGLYFATRYTLKEQLQLLAWMYGISVVLSILFAIVPPHYGIMGGVHAGAFRGIHLHKNGFGKIMVPGVIVFALLAIDTPKYRVLLWGSCAVTVALLILAESTTAVVNTLILVAALQIYRAFRWRYTLLVPSLFALFFASVGSYTLLIFNSDTFFNLLGKDPSLTGRTDFWPIVVEIIAKRPWLGYGYNAFWNGVSDESAYIAQAARWEVPDSHNGLLDVWLMLGAVGVTLFLFSFWTSAVRAIAWIRLNPRPEAVWPMLYLTYMVLANLTESSLMIQNNMFWMLYSATVFSVLMPPATPASIAPAPTVPEIL